MSPRYDIFTGPALRLYVTGRGYKAEPILNIGAVEEGTNPLKIMGYRLLGPRGNKTTIAQNPDGNYSFNSVKLWCDGVDYATKKIEARKT